MHAESCLVFQSLSTQYVSAAFQNSANLQDSNFNRKKMTSQSSSLLPDPRLKNKIAQYDRDEIVADIFSFYNFLPHVSASNIARAPPDGWPEITASSLAVHGIHKTPEAIELMRHLPYISYEQPWIMITANGVRLQTCDSIASSMA